MMQPTLTAGDTLNYRAVVALYPASDRWALVLRLVPRAAGGTPIELQARADGDEHLVRASSGTTGTWVPGAYGWSAWVQRDGERYTVESGQLTVLPDPAQVTQGADTRTLAQRALDEATAAFAAWSPTVRRYRIADREREFNSAAEILVVIRYWESRVRKEAGGKGRPAPTRLHTRFR